MPPPVSPMMAQYLEIKEQHEGALLFYRMGDFYEMFFDDAVAASEALDITLTKRGRLKGQDIPMCGVPVHAANGYMDALIRKGFRVAVCEQTEDPSEARRRGAHAVVDRKVVRLITPGTLTEDTHLDARRNNFLACVARVRGEAALAWADISSGFLGAMPCPLVKLGPQLARISPREILVSEAELDGLSGILGDRGPVLTPLAPVNFDSAAAEGRLLELFGVGTLDAFGEFGRAELSALGAIIAYFEITQKGKLPALRPPSRERPESSMQIDAATRRNLEISSDFAGGRENSLLAAIDLTASAAGARLLEQRISAPSTDLEEIRDRHGAIGSFLEDAEMRGAIRSLLRGLPDIDRALSRLCLERGGPRDLAALRDGLSLEAEIRSALPREGLPRRLMLPCDDADAAEGILQLLRSAIVDGPPASVREGNFVQQGFDDELDQERKLRDEARNVIAELGARYAAETGIQPLKTKFNNVLGYFVEVPPAHANRLMSPPLSETFIHRQTLASAARFKTLELSDLESRILGAAGKAEQIEKRIFEDLRGRAAAAASAISSAARTMAEVDLASAMAELAEARGWCRPVVDDSGALEIEGGRHPVVEESLQKSGGGPFIANDCELAPPDGDGPRVQILTGPNMAGKSTYLRQNALIALLAQAGCYVPARAARVGVASQLFSRVGAADELARGRSTFMVEMVETAAILHQADIGALVVLDEIGRGTATFDGLSIAWATLEHIHDVNKCRALFATHYHELARLSDRLGRLANSTVAVREWEGEVVFLHEVKPGSADRSYGIQVAKLAGIPDSVIERAREVLEGLEADELDGGKRLGGLLEGLPLFSAPARSPEPPSPDEAEVSGRLEKINPDQLSPRDALELIYELKEAVRRPR